jgi:hypothetical protein
MGGPNHLSLQSSSKIILGCFEIEDVDLFVRALGESVSYATSSCGIFESHFVSIV